MEQQTTKCPRCDFKASTEDNYCIMCGKRLKERCDKCCQEIKEKN
jgi:predicted amidophosphoribosyltransferase